MTYRAYITVKAELRIGAEADNIKEAMARINAELAKFGEGFHSFSVDTMTIQQDTPLRRQREKANGGRIPE